MYSIRARSGTSETPHPSPDQAQDGVHLLRLLRDPRYEPGAAARSGDAGVEVGALLERNRTKPSSARSASTMAGLSAIVLEAGSAATKRSR
jgi:hypothetical protein